MMDGNGPACQLRFVSYVEVNGETRTIGLKAMHQEGSNFVIGGDDEHECNGTDFQG